MYFFCVSSSNALGTHDLWGTITSTYFGEIDETSALTPQIGDGFGTQSADALYLHTSSYTGSATGYKAGEPMLAIYSSIVVGAAGNTLQNLYLPARDYGGSCLGKRTVTFLTDVAPSPDTECMFHIHSLSEACAANGILDVTTYASNIYVAMQSNGTILPPTGTTQWKGVRYAVAKGSFGSTQVASSGDVNTGLTRPWYSLSTGTCYNVISSIDYYITYEASTGVIIEVAASATVTDVSDNGVKSIKAGFGVHFIANGTNPANAPYRSGTPGYIPGAKLLAGYLTTYGGKQAIYQLVSGASILAPGSS